MIKLNKYLQELGIDENYWLFNKENNEDPRYEEDEEGFKDAEFFSLDISLSLYIYSHLCYFRDHCLVGMPVGMEFEEWKSIIDKMIEAFKLIIISDTDALESKKRNHKINRGLKLFAKYFRDLWY